HLFGFGGQSSLLPSAFAMALASALPSALGARATGRRRKGRDVADTAGRGVRGPYRKSAARRRAIIEAAAVVFARSGYRGATIRDIAAEAGISPSSLLHFYRTKQELLWATMTYRDDRRFSGSGEGSGSGSGDGSGSGSGDGSVDGSGSDSLGFADTVVGQAVANEEVPHLIQLYAVLSAESATRDHPGKRYFSDRFASLRSQYTREFTALAEAGLRRGGGEPAVAAVTVVALWDGVQLQWLHEPEVISAAEVLREYFRLVLTDPDLLTPTAQLRRAWQQQGGAMGAAGDQL